MGINICAYYLGERIIESDMMGEYSFLDKKEHPTFSYIREVGDEDFIYLDIEWEFEYDDIENKDYERSYRRPKDIPLAIEWVKQNISKTSRLIVLLEEMLISKNLYIKISY